MSVDCHACEVLARRRPVQQVVDAPVQPIHDLGNHDQLVRYRVKPRSRRLMRVLDAQLRVVNAAQRFATGRRCRKSEVDLRPNVVGEAHGSSKDRLVQNHADSSRAAGGGSVGPVSSPRSSVDPDEVKTA